MGEDHSGRLTLTERAPSEKKRRMERSDKKMALEMFSNLYSYSIPTFRHISFYLNATSLSKVTSIGQSPELAAIVILLPN